MSLHVTRSDPPNKIFSLFNLIINSFKILNMTNRAEIHKFNKKVNRGSFYFSNKSFHIKSRSVTQLLSTG